jgi:hypothetical protein
MQEADFTQMFGRSEERGARSKKIMESQTNAHGRADPFRSRLSKGFPEDSGSNDFDGRSKGPTGNRRYAGDDSKFKRPVPCPARPSPAQPSPAPQCPIVSIRLLICPRKIVIGASLSYPASSIQHPAFSIQHPAPSILALACPPRTARPSR